MALTPHHHARSLGPKAAAIDSPFQLEADASLARFRSIREDLERQVRRGDLTAKAARQRASDAAAALRQQLLAQADGYSPVPRIFLNRLTQVAEARARARETSPLDVLQRETNQLLRMVLTEQQIVNRAREFEERAYVRPIQGGMAVPTLEGLLRFHDQTTQSGDEVGREWTRRQLEAFRARTTNPEDLKRIDDACDRPEQVNAAIVARYVEALANVEAAGLERFVKEAIESRDANACCAAFLLAREAPVDLDARWARQVLDGVGVFPDASLAALRTWEADSRRADAEAARTRADYVIAVTEAEAELPELEVPSDSDLRRQARVRARPVAQPDQPIGLSLQHRGLTTEEYADLQLQAAPSSSEQVEP